MTIKIKKLKKRIVLIFSFFILESCLVPGAPHKHMYSSLERSQNKLINNGIHKFVTPDSIYIYTIVGAGSYPKVKYPGLKISIANYSNKMVSFNPDSVYIESKKIEPFSLQTLFSHKEITLAPYDNVKSDSIPFILYSDTLKISDRKWNNMIRKDTIILNIKLNEKRYELKYQLPD